MFSQNEYKKSVDSLYVLINDTNNNHIKINHYKELCDIYRKYDILKFNTCNEKLGKITIKTKELGFYFVNKAKIVSVKNDHCQSLVYARKAKEIFYKFKDWDNYIISSCEFAIYLSINDENAKAKNILQNILNLAITRKSKNSAVVYFNFANFYNNRKEKNMLKS